MTEPRALVPAGKDEEIDTGKVLEILTGTVEEILTGNGLAAETGTVEPIETGKVVEVEVIFTLPVEPPPEDEQPIQVTKLEPGELTTTATTVPEVAVVKLARTDIAPLLLAIN